jgi:uncharacterized membrane protein
VTVEVLVMDKLWPTRGKAAISYLGPLVFIPLFYFRQDKFIHFHTRQGLALWVVLIIAITSLLLPGSGKFLFVVLSGIYSAAVVAGLISALIGSTWQIPVLGTLAKRYF